MLITGPDASNRLYAEQEKLRTYFPQFAFARSADGNLFVRGTLRTNSGQSYPIRVVLSSDYPHGIPCIYPDGWDSACPHIYRAGNLCIMRPDQWRAFYSIAFAVAKTAIWLNKFEVFKARGYWPGNEQQH